MTARTDLTHSRTITAIHTPSSLVLFAQSVTAMLPQLLALKLVIKRSTVPLKTATTSEEKLYFNYKPASRSLDSVNLDPITQVDDVEDEPEDACNGKPPTGNRLRAVLRMGRTHNEQLIMWACGVITSRATFFGSEGIASVYDFLKATFPTPESTPEYFVFDNNCKLQAHIQTINDHDFDNTGMPVDVFHFKSKHKVTDTFCQDFCNPAAFPELIDKGEWKVNPSICEETNVWFGGYQAIVQDMEVTRYNFFLDEMIKRHNHHVVEELEVQGKHPWCTPITVC
ncbi:hypothetical protein DXG01_003298 [Tephrocybe rancida]|nr:hypothetical protein DXG01_003298 [Tephrocybe rancida]